MIRAIQMQKARAFPRAFADANFTCLEFIAQASGDKVVVGLHVEEIGKPATVRTIQLVS